MRCKSCNTELRYTGNVNLTTCVICGQPMTPDMDDIFVNGMYQITKEHRPAQFEMAKKIDHFYKNTDQKILIIEGGTGIGKSFAYLIPALKYAITHPYDENDTSKKRLIISTAKKSLQEQLVEKDLPYLVDKMRITSPFTQIKGNADYLCFKQLETIPPEDKQDYITAIKKAKEKETYIDLSRWNKEKPIWWEITSVANCPSASSCRHANYCKPRAKSFEIVVVNHHILAIDLLNPGHLLGGYHYLVIDEAHQAPEAFRSAHTKEISPNKTAKIKKELINNTNVRTAIIDYISRNLIPGLIDNTNNIIHLLTKLEEYAKKTKNTCNCVNPQDKNIQKILTELFPKTSYLFNEIETIIKKLRDKYEVLTIECAIKENKQDDSLILLFKALTTLNKISRVANTQNQLIMRTLTNAEDYILTITDKGLKSIPINIGTFFKKSIEQIPKCVITSATLTINNNFKYTLDSFGLNENTTKAIYASPYNLHKQARLYMPIDMPLPGYGDTPERKKWINALSTEIAQIAGVIKGNILILFTATTDKNEFYDKLITPLQNLNLTPIDQGQNAQNALKCYLKSKNPILFGLKSFWEGIDLPGKTLQCVIITKLPFPYAKDPIISTLVDKANNGFRDIQIPKMIFDMKQGTGRLIRSMSDKGIIVCLDSRIWTGTSNIQRHSELITRIKNDKDPITNKPIMKRIGYGKELVNALGYTVQSKFKAMEHWANSNLEYLQTK